MKLDDKEKSPLIDGLNLAWQNLRGKDYEDNDSHTYHMLTDFIKKVKDEKKLETYQSAILVKSAGELLAILD